MMKIKGMRWSCERVGMGIQFLDDEFIVEIQVEDGQGAEKYVSYAKFQDDNLLKWSSVPLFEYLTNIKGDWFDADEFVEDRIEYMDTEMPDEKFAGHPYRHVIRLLNLAMDRQLWLYANNDKTSDGDAKAFIEPYIDKDVDVMDLPIVYPYEVDDEGEDEE